MAVDYQKLERIKTYMVNQKLYSKESGILQYEDINLSITDFFDDLIYFLNIQNNADFDSFPLSRIELRNCSLTDDHIQKLIEVLEKHPSILYIDLKENLVTDKGAGLLDKYASEHSVEIDLRFNKISENYSQQGSLLNISEQEQIDLHFDDKHDEEHVQRSMGASNLAESIRQAFLDELRKGQFDAGRALNGREHLPGVPSLNMISEAASFSSGMHDDTNQGEKFIDDCKARIVLLLDQVFPLLFEPNGDLLKPFIDIFDEYLTQSLNEKKISLDQYEVEKAKLNTPDFKVKILIGICATVRSTNESNLHPSDYQFIPLLSNMMKNVKSNKREINEFVSTLETKPFNLMNFKQELLARFNLPENQEYFEDLIENMPVINPNNRTTNVSLQNSQVLTEKKSPNNLPRNQDSVPLKVMIPLAILFAPITLMVVTVFLIHELFSKALSLVPDIKPPKDLYNTANPVRNVTTAKSVIEHTALPQTLSK